MAKTYKARKIDITKSPKALKELPVISTDWFVTGYYVTLKMLQCRDKADNVAIRFYLCDLIGIDAARLEDDFYLNEITVAQDGDGYITEIKFRLLSDAYHINDLVRVLNFGSVHYKYIVTNFQVYTGRNASS
jgi:hypothetical protein